MTNKEMLMILKGNHDGKLRLFNELTEKVQSGTALEDGEVPVFEALKKELLKPASVVVSLEANLTGSSGTKVG
jgi:predicted transcriptional regulator